MTEGELEHCIKQIGTMFAEMKGLSPEEEIETLRQMIAEEWVTVSESDAFIWLTFPSGARAEFRKMPLQ